MKRATPPTATGGRQAPGHRSWRLLLVAAVLALALLPSGNRAGAAPGGVAVAQPVLGVADLASTLMGATATGQTWAYRRLPREVGPPVIGGSTLQFGPTPPGGAQPPGQLAFLRYTEAAGWQVAETPLGRNGQPAR